MIKRPILFSGPMVRAILDGKKTQTRRVVRAVGRDLRPVLLETQAFIGRNTPWLTDHSRDPRGLLVPSPCGYPGDRLWVREAWAIKNWTDAECVKMGYANAPQHPTETYLDVPTRAIYREGWRAEWDRMPPAQRWTPAIHMPRWASRLMLVVTEVRVERVQDISEDDAIAEGCFDEKEHDGSLPSEIYRQLWDSLYAKRGWGWDANPWVWVVSFRKVAP